MAVHSFDIDYQRTKWRLGSLGVGLCSGVMVVGLPSPFGLLMGALGLVAAMALALRAERHRVLVGADAVVIEFGVRRHQLPLRDIVAVKKQSRDGSWGVRLKCHDGQEHFIVTDSDWLLNDGVVAKLLMASIAQNYGSDDGGWEAMLSYQGGHFGEWLAGVEKLASKSASYRGQAVSSRQLARFSADPEAEFSARVAAAWLLRLRDSSRGRRALNDLLKSMVHGAAREQLVKVINTRKRSVARRMLAGLAKILWQRPAASREGGARIAVEAASARPRRRVETQREAAAARFAQRRHARAVSAAEHAQAGQADMETEEAEAELLEAEEARASLYEAQHKPGGPFD